MRALLLGDTHIGAGAEYGAQPGDRLADQERVLERIVDLAIEQRVDAVLHAGDMWHRRRPTPAEYLAVARPLGRLQRELGCDVLAISGNHCVEHPDLPIAAELLTGLLDVRREPGLWHGPGVTVCCLPWTPVSRLVAQRGGGDRDGLAQEAAQMLLSIARDLHAQALDGYTVLLTHWSISGAFTPTGAATDEFREVVLPLEEVEALGFDAVVAGHIHLPAIVGDARLGMGVVGQPVLYVGSPFPVDFGEGDSLHGVWILDTEAAEPATFFPVDSRPFVTIDVDLVAEAQAGSELQAAVDEGSLKESWAPSGWSEQKTVLVAIGQHRVEDAVVRLRYTATEEQARHVDHAAVTAALLDAGAHRVYAIQPTILRQNRVRVEGLDEDLDPMQAVGMWTAAEGLDDARADQLAGVALGYVQQVPA